MRLGSVEHFTKLYEDMIADRVAEDVKTGIAEELDIAKGLIKTLSKKVDELKRENKELKKEIILNKNLKNFMVDGFDIDNPYNYR
tara:strand:+ start:146 stop:400 length:255 start_codon:yes stop_codon:yes gene_type:complete